MNLEEVKRIRKIIESVIDDPEAAHAYEDRLLDGFVDHVASMYENPRFSDPYTYLHELGEMAKELKKIKALEFPRWYA